MLPAHLTSANLRRAVITCVTALAIALPVTPAFAFNQREQDVLKGIVGTLVIQGLIKHQSQQQVQKTQKFHPVAPRYSTRNEPYYEPRPRYHEPRVSVYRTPAAAAFSSYSPSERRMIQRRLSRMGYYLGGVDGAFGPGTYSAISAYARDQGLTASLGNTRNAYAVYDSLIF
jgi:hypothetical protein